MKYTAIYEREPDGRWTVEIAEVKGCHTYGRTIEQAKERVREALGLFVDDAGRAELVDKVKLPDDVNKVVRAAKALREKSRAVEGSMLTAQHKAVKALRRLNLGHRDAGMLLGLSHQRVHQLEKREAVRPVHPGVIAEAAHVPVRRAAKKK